MRKIFLGPPGSGKGTAASRVAPKFKIPHISTGDLLRENIKNITEIGMKAKEFMDNGKLVPDKIVIEMLKQRISKPDCEEGFILDGFPRTIPQAEMLEKLADIDLVVNMNVTDDVVVKRLSSRITCKDCSEVFNLIGLPPKKAWTCDKCEGQLTRRSDDEPETIQNRLDIYKKQTQPLIDFYKNKGNLINVTCANVEQTVEETFQSVIDAINNFLEKKE
ncbi:MAG: adenylate kinase [archaeon]